MKSITFAIDFDGTVVTHDFPEVGKDIGAVPVLKALVAKGHKLILWTMRSDVENAISEDAAIHTEPGQFLTDALNWFKQNNIPLYGVQCNPTQHSWTTSKKCYAEIYIDDAALGCPLFLPHENRVGVLPDHRRAYVNWEKVERLLVKKGLL